MASPADFLDATAALPSLGNAAAGHTRTNWAGNTTFAAESVACPGDLSQLQELVRTLPRLKPLGTAHSFNQIADTDGTQLDLRAFGAIRIDASAQKATVGAAVTYGQLAPRLQEAGFALPNLASLPHISAVGACATGTHGSGVGNGCLATAVAALELVDGKGMVRRVSRDGASDDDALFPLAVVGLGALGVITAVTLDLVPTFQVAQMVYQDLPFATLADHLPEILAAGYSVSLFTSWQQQRIEQIWVKRRLKSAQDTGEFPASLFGALRQQHNLHPLPGLSAASCTEQMGVPGPWHERLPHFRMDFTPSAGAELQTEYFVSLDQGMAAILAVAELRELLAPHLFISEVRTIAADDLPLSMCCGRSSLALHFTWKPHVEAVLALLPRLEAALEPFAARPHWAKLFTVPPQRLRELYPALSSLALAAGETDPLGRFRNAFLDPLLRAGQGPAR